MYLLFNIIFTNLKTVAGRCHITNSTFITHENIKVYILLYYITIIFKSIKGLPPKLFYC